MMKSKIHLKTIIWAVIGSTFLLTSCLKEQPRSLLNEDKAYDNATNLYINTVATLYNHIGGKKESEGLMGTYRGVYDYNTFTTDEAIIPTRGGDWYDGGYWQQMYLHKWTPSDLSLLHTWNYLYNVVMLCNHSLAEIKKHQHLLSEQQFQEYNAEVIGIRCLFYYELMDMFGRVPLVEHDQLSLAEVKQVERGEMFQHIVNQLQDILPYLPNQRSNFEGKYYGRMTRPVAEFLLAKLFLNAEVYGDNQWTDSKKPSGSEMQFAIDGKRMNAWEACVHYCDRLSAFGYQLSPEYQTNFQVHNETSKENIFTIPMDKIKYQNQYWYLFRSRHYAHGSAIGMDAENGASATLSTVKAFGYNTPQTDPRYAYNFYSDTLKINGKPVILDDGKPLVYQPLAIRLDLTTSPYLKTAGARMAKYEIDYTAHADGKLQDNDIVLFRYADALLMKAEALVRNGQSGQAELDRVRRRVGLPTRQATLENILEERRLELMWEGTRRQDLIRFGLYHHSYDIRPALPNEHTAYTTVFPIPSRVLEHNKLLTQNSGYPTR